MEQSTAFSKLSAKVNTCKGKIHWEPWNKIKYYHTVFIHQFHNPFAYKMETLKIETGSMLNRLLSIKNILKSTYYFHAMQLQDSGAFQTS